jgi:hypothetical protein
MWIYYTCIFKQFVSDNDVSAQLLMLYDVDVDVSFTFFN